MKSTVTLWAFTPKGETGLTWLVAQAICLWTRSKWFHVGVSVDNLYTEARPFLGVVATTIVPHDAIKIKSWEVESDPRVLEWVSTQVGKPYDWAGVFGFVIGPSWRGRADRGHWFCSEFGTVLMRKLRINVMMASLGEPWRWQHVPAWEIQPSMLVTECRRP